MVFFLGRRDRKLWAKRHYTITEAYYDFVLKQFKSAITVKLVSIQK